SRGRDERSGRRERSAGIVLNDQRDELGRDERVGAGPGQTRDAEQRPLALPVPARELAAQARDADLQVLELAVAVVVLAERRLELRLGEQRAAERRAILGHAGEADLAALRPLGVVTRG